ncbi:heme A synthase [bacterium]|nr:heme A synthase [bacterium]
MAMTNSSKRPLVISLLITLILIFGLIFVGSTVRSTEAGMGCPDWPKCFGQWIPPTSESQLPANYRELYAHRGYAELSFNPVKTWTEYINRLLGVMIGFVVIINGLVALINRKALPRSRPLWLSWSAILLVGFQGWLGAVVVASVLTPWIITAHMAVAMATIIVLSVALADLMPETRSRITPAYLITFIAMAIEFIIGSQVRQRVDHLSGPVHFYQLGNLASVHFALAWIVAITVLWLIREMRHRPGTLWTRVILGSCLFLQMTSGIVFYRIGLVSMLQPVHLTVAAIMLGVLVYEGSRRTI